MAITDTSRGLASGLQRSASDNRFERGSLSDGQAVSDQTGKHCLDSASCSAHSECQWNGSPFCVVDHPIAQRWKIQSGKDGRQSRGKASRKTSGHHYGKSEGFSNYFCRVGLSYRGAVLNEPRPPSQVVQWIATALSYGVPIMLLISFL